VCRALLCAGMAGVACHAPDATRTLSNLPVNRHSPWPLPPAPCPPGPTLPHPAPPAHPFCRVVRCALKIGRIGCTTHDSRRVGQYSCVLIPDRSIS
jgi:hypothetical protein